jgi:hypothetical protein
MVAATIIATKVFRLFAHRSSTIQQGASWYAPVDVRVYHCKRKVSEQAHIKSLDSAAATIATAATTGITIAAAGVCTIATNWRERFPTSD